VVFPESEVLLRTRSRLAGLFGDVLREEHGRKVVILGLVDDRNASFALGGKGTASGEEMCAGFPNGVVEGVVETARLWGVGESGDFAGEALGDLVMSRNFEGDLDRERLNDRTADPTST